MKQPIKNILPVLLVFLIVTLACNFPTVESNQPQQVTQPTAAVEVEDLNFDDLFQQDPSGAITITLTEQQLTAYLVSEMETEDEPMLRNPQVSLQNGQVIVTGQTNRGPITADVRMVMVVNIVGDGELDFQVVSADLGPMSAPADVTSQLTTLANDTFRSSLGPQMEDFRAESVNIADGRLIVTGRQR